MVLSYRAVFARNAIVTTLRELFELEIHVWAHHWRLCLTQYHLTLLKAKPLSQKYGGSKCRIFRRNQFMRYSLRKEDTLTNPRIKSGVVPQLQKEFDKLHNWAKAHYLKRLLCIKKLDIKNSSCNNKVLRMLVKRWLITNKNFGFKSWLL